MRSSALPVEVGAGSRGPGNGWLKRATFSDTTGSSDDRSMVGRPQGHPTNSCSALATGRDLGKLRGASVLQDKSYEGEDMANSAGSKIRISDRIERPKRRTKPLESFASH